MPSNLLRFFRLCLIFILLASLFGMSPRAIQAAPTRPTDGVILDIAAGIKHTCALIQTTSGTIMRCWGDNSSGQLGTGNTTSSSVPVDVVGLPSNLIQITASSYNTCALTADGKVFCWGPVIAHSNTPVLEQDLPVNVVEVRLGDLHLCARTSDGGVKCLGYNGEGQLGDGTWNMSFTPVDVVGLSSGVLAISAGRLHTCALTSGGGVQCWGRNVEGQLGDNSFANQGSPVMPAGLSSGVIAVTAGGAHTCAILTNGTVKCWGSNDEGESGDENAGPTVGAPINISSLVLPATALALGEQHSCALTVTGAVRCWGYPYFGSGGTGVAGMTGSVSVIASGSYHICAAVPINTGEYGLRCQGSNDAGQLGATTPDTYMFDAVDVVGLMPHIGALVTGRVLFASGIPVGDVTLSLGQGLSAQSQLDGSFALIDVAGGSYTLTPSKAGCTFSPASRSVTAPPDRTGQDFTATCTQPHLSGAISVGVGGHFACALTSQGGVMCWGENGSAQLGNGASDPYASPFPVSGLSSGVALLAVGYVHSCVVTQTDEVKCWGDNSAYQLGDGADASYLLPVSVNGLSAPGTPPVKALALGRQASCALLNDDTVRCWGRSNVSKAFSNSVDPRPVPGLSGAQSIVAGSDHACALMPNGGVKCWGSNLSGQLGDGTTNDRAIPVDVTNFSGLTGQPKVLALAASNSSTCALTDAHQITCWGWGYGQNFGGSKVGGFEDSLPAAIGGKTPDTYCARAADGSLRCWSSWTGSPDRPHTASIIPGLEKNVTSFDANGNNVCALTSTGGLKCWGDNSRGQIGNGTIIGLAPMPVAGLSGVTGLSASDHTCAVANGGLQCWGRDDTFHYGFLGTGRAENELLPTPISGMQSGVVAVASGFDHTCALSSAGGVLCWGANAKGQVGAGSDEWNFTGPVFVQGLRSGVTAIAAGRSHTCALLSTGGVKCWGAGDEGQLGSGGMSNSTVPVDVTGLAGAPGEPVIKTIAAGAYHTCAVSKAGAVWCWGVNAKGQLGNAANNDSLTPVQVSGLSGATGEPAVKGLALGGDHSCAITASGMQCWGAGDSGQLGNGGTDDKNTPAAVSGLGAGILSASAGDGHTCALMTGGALKCWGANGSGQLGNGTVRGSLIPQAVSGLSSGVTSVAAGYNHTCTVANGGLQCWGDNSMAQLGSGGTYLVSPAVDVIPQPAPITYTLSGTVKDKNSQPVVGVTVSVTGSQANTGGDGSFALSGLVSGTYTLTPKKSECTFTPASRTVGVPPSAIGLNFTANCLTPLDGIGQVRTGYVHTCAISQEGEVYCWGMNQFGQLGDGDMKNSLMAKAVKGLTEKVKDLTLAEKFICALTTAGAVSCWGKVPGVATFQTIPYPISSWSNGIQAISAGRYHVCALTTTGTVQCMGVSLNGELGDGKNKNSDVPVDVTGLSSGVTAISAGPEHTCALTTTGAVKCWGYNGAGQLGNGGKTDQYTPVTVNGFTGMQGAVKVKAISAGGYSTCALTASGEAWCWGDGSSGELGDGLSSDELQPVEVSGLQIGIASIHVGGGYVCELLIGGKVSCWGILQGELESTSLNYPRSAPWPVEGLASITSISVGGGWISLHNQPWGYACAVTQDGKIQCWGSNGMLGIKDASKLGNNDTADSAEPVYVVKGRVVQKEYIYLPFMVK